MAASTISVALRTLKIVAPGIAWRRVLTDDPAMILSPRYDATLEIFDTLHDNGIQLAWMAHFSTPRELLNPSTLAAIRRLQNHGVVLRSQSPMMNHISLFTDEDGKVDVDRSAQNWIDLAQLLGTMHIGFHSMYCARPTGEHHYFTAPLADVAKIANQIHRSLASIDRPSRYISMTSSAGKISILGTVEVGGEQTLEQSLRAVRVGGTLSMIGVLSGGKMDVRLGPIVTRAVRMQGVTVGSRADFEAMARAIDQHRLQPVVDRVFEFDELRPALDYLASGAQFGKICIRHD